MRRSRFLISLCCKASVAACLLATPPLFASEVPAISFADYSVVPEQIPGDADRFGGISGLDYDRNTGLFWAVSDARNTDGQGKARGYTLRITAGGSTGFEITDIRRFDLPGRTAGAGFAAGEVTAEAIGISANGSYYWASEGDCGISEPSLWHVDQSGGLSAPISLQPEYHYAPGCKSEPEAGLTGAPDNGALEALALSTDGQTLYYANEDPLLQDPTTGPDRSVRITAQSLTGASDVRQFAYRIPAPFGLVELLTLDQSRLLALQRYYVRASNATVARLAVFELNNASDISSHGVEGLPTDAVAVREVSELLALNAGRARNANANLYGSGAPMDNLEAMAIGCVSGETLLVLAADDNFDKYGPQNNLFLLFRISGIESRCDTPAGRG